MLSISKMIESARNALGWPYDSPGSNDSSGIDCSGLFVRMYRDQGSNIAHGSNSIFHKYLSEAEPLSSASQLVPGMAVFKLKAWTDADRGNQWYGREPGNLSHIGFVASAYPLEIIHASSEAGKVTIDTSIKRWAYCGKLKDVDYSGQPSPEPGPAPEPTPEPEPEPEYATVWSQNGKSVNTRKGPDETYALSRAGKIPVGDTVEILKKQTNSQGENWCRIRWQDPRSALWVCWIKADFLKFDKEPSPEPEPAIYTVHIPYLTEYQAEAFVRNYSGSWMTKEG